MKINRLTGQKFGRLRSFSSEIKAAKIYNKAAYEDWEENDYLNKIEESDINNKKSN